MKTATPTIRLDEDLDKLLTKAPRQSGLNRSMVARDALRRQLRISHFDALRHSMMPFAEARGYLTDEDVFADAGVRRWGGRRFCFPGPSGTN
jgi:predicted transcriptional regulator